MLGAVPVLPESSICAEQMLYDAENSIELPGLVFWADGQKPGFRLLNNPVAAEGEGAIELLFPACKSYSEIGFNSMPIPQGTRALTFCYKDVTGSPLFHIEIRETGKDGTGEVRADTEFKWTDSRKWVTARIPLSSFSDPKDRRLTGKQNTRILFRYFGKTPASIKLDSLAWETPAGLVMINDFEKYNAAAWLPKGISGWADAQSTRPAVELLVGTRAITGNASLRFTFCACRSYQGISFYNLAPLPAESQAISFRYRMISGKFPPLLRLLHNVIKVDGEKSSAIFVCRSFAPAADGKWHTAVIPLSDFQFQQAAENDSGTHCIQPGSKLSFQLCTDGGESGAGVFEFDDLKWISTK